MDALGIGLLFMVVIMSSAAYDEVRKGRKMIASLLDAIRRLEEIVGIEQENSSKDQPPSI